ncbi:hypothetical protein [Gemmatimonas sp.]|uniref:hypothetical protein n=1 Tax=Gemmatimonas sp. TaxID=1962908 RepID=UPI003982E1A6
MDQNAPRRYDDEETSLILEQASRLDTDETADEQQALSGQSLRSSAQGLTLAELQSIGEEAGISAAAVARAAVAIARGDHLAPERQMLLGLPVGVARTVVFDRRVTDAEWERMVVLFRRTFGVTGVLRSEGSLREWRNGRLCASLEPTARGGHQLRLSTNKSDARTFNVLGAVGSILGLSLTGLVAVQSGLDPSAAWFGPIAIAVGGLSALARNALVLPRWYAERARQMFTISMGVSEIVEDGDSRRPLTGSAFDVR